MCMTLKGRCTKVTGVRAMDPVGSGKCQYPCRYVSYMNASEQTVNPEACHTILNSECLVVSHGKTNGCRRAFE